MKRKLAWAAILLMMAFVIGADSVQTESHSKREFYAWNGPLPSPDTLRIIPPSSDIGTRIVYLYVSNSAGGTATSARVAIKRYTGYSTTAADSASDTLVVWQAIVSGGPAAAPALAQVIAPPGGLFTSRPGDTLKVITTMASATSLYVACKYEMER